MSAYVPLPLKISSTSLGAGEQNLWYTGTQIAALLAASLLCALNLRQVLGVARHAFLMNGFLLLAAVSVAWSFAPVISLRRVATLAAAVAFAYYLVATTPIERALRTFAAAFAVAALASAAVAIGFPEIGLMGAGEVASPELVGAWCGVFTHKNELGLNMALGMQTCLWLALDRGQTPRGRLLAIAGMLICTAVAFGSRSRTAEISILVTPLLFYGLRMCRLPGLALLWAGFAGLLAALAGSAVILLFFEGLMQAIGKDPSLTGRAPLWSELIGLAMSRPLRGYGYMAFFVDGNADFEAVQRAIGWDAPDAHQSYLDIMLQLGLPGLLMAALLITSGLARALAAVRAKQPAWASLGAVVLLTWIVTGLSEATLLRAGNISVLMIPLFHAGLTTAAARRNATKGARPVPVHLPAAPPAGPPGPSVLHV